MDIPPGPKGSQKITVKIRITDDNLLQVTTTKMHNGQQQNFEIEPERAGGLTQAMVDEMIEQGNFVRNANRLSGGETGNEPA